MAFRKEKASSDTINPNFSSLLIDPFDEEVIKAQSESKDADVSTLENQFSCLTSNAEALLFNNEPIDLNPFLEAASNNERSSALFRTFLSRQGFGSHHIAVFDNWTNCTAKLNIAGKELTFPNGNLIKFSDLRIQQPTYTKNGNSYKLTPKYAREQGFTYSSEWYVTATLINAEGNILQRRENILVGKVPTMIKSNYCYLRGCSRQELALYGEDPDDAGGYFIIKGSEKVILLQEMLTVNKVLTTMDKKKGPITRIISSTPRGTSKLELSFDIDTKAVEIEFPSIKIPADAQVKGKMNETVNVLLVFKLLGIVYGIGNIDTQSGIESIIRLFIKPEYANKTLLQLERSWVYYVNTHMNVVKMLNKKIGKDVDHPESTVEIKKVFDTDLFPHMNLLPHKNGETPAEYTLRIGMSKVYMLAAMTARLIENQSGYLRADDRDSWSNKRAEGAGRMMESLLRSAWRVTCNKLQTLIDEKKVSDFGAIVENLTEKSIITETFIDSFVSQQWGVKGPQGASMKKNVAQTLFRDSVVATLTHINTVDVAIERTDKQDKVRKVQMSQLGYICVVTSAEGEICGLVKNLASTARLSLEITDREIIRYLYGDVDMGLHPYVTLNPYANSNAANSNAATSTNLVTHKVLVNGKFLGWCDGVRTRNYLVELRRSYNLPIDMSVIIENDWLYIDIGPSRLMRPLLIVDPETQELVLDQKGLRHNGDILSWIKNGAMEYISSWEQEYIKLAATVDEISNRKTKIANAEAEFNEATLDYNRVKNGETVLITVNDGLRNITEEEILENIKLVNQDTSLRQEERDELITNYNFDLKAIKNGEPIHVVINERLEPLTLDGARERLAERQKVLDKARSHRLYTHCEIDPQAILSVAATLIPWPNHNQAPRNTYQVNMSKQALGVYHTNHQNRFDGKIKVLAFPTQPLVESDSYDIVGLNKRGQGENITVAFMLWPYTEEDSFVMKDSFLKNGAFRITKYFTVKTIVNNQNGISERLDYPSAMRPGEAADKYKYICKEGSSIGLPYIGAPLKQGNCIIYKTQGGDKSQDGRLRAEPIIMRVGDEGIVDKVQYTFDQKAKIITVKLRTMRVPEAGDKFAPRCAQKGTIGHVQPDIEMPFSIQSGMIPDIVVNCHCFTADTIVLQRNGLAKRLGDMKYDGGEDIWSWDKNNLVYQYDQTMGIQSQGIKDIVQLTLNDGRKLKCTGNHRIPVMEIENEETVHKTVEAKDITPNMCVYAGIEGVLDNPTPEEIQIEANWELEADTEVFVMDTPENREISLAFARIVGMICTDGCVGEYKSNKSGGVKMRANIAVGCQIDINSVLTDIKLVTGKDDIRVVKSSNDIAGTVSTIYLPDSLAKAIGSLDGMPLGRKTTQKPRLPKVFFDPSCPKSFIREFLGGMFGGDGWSPTLHTAGKGRPFIFTAPAISKSTTIDRTQQLIKYYEKMNMLLSRLDVTNGTIGTARKKYTCNGIQMVSIALQLQMDTTFGNKIGFRHCTQKMMRMSVFQSYMKYLENVKKQGDFVIKRASEIFDNNELPGRATLSASLEKARDELRQREFPLNEYYSCASLTSLSNRRKPNRSNVVKSWDYDKIDSPGTFTKNIGAWHWFRPADKSTSGTKADYIVKRKQLHLPYFTLKVVDIRQLPPEEVFDLGSKFQNSFVAEGISVFNSIPSRMTLSYLMELLASKHATMRGEHINGGPFQAFDLDRYQDTMKEYGMDEYGYETLRSGTSGKLLETKIFMGPVYFQALKHHVKDKTQTRSQGSISSLTRQPPRGRGNRGGLRLTLLAYVEDKTSASPRHMGQHIQIQGNSCPTMIIISYKILLPSRHRKLVDGFGENSKVWL